MVGSLHATSRSMEWRMEHSHFYLVKSSLCTALQAQSYRQQHSKRCHACPQPSALLVGWGRWSPAHNGEALNPVESARPQPNCCSGQQGPSAGLPHCVKLPRHCQLSASFYSCRVSLLTTLVGCLQLQTRHWVLHLDMGSQCR